MFAGRALHWDRPAASPSSAQSEPTTSLAPPSIVPPAPPEPVVVPQAIPLRVTIQTHAGILVDNVPVDSNLLLEVNGAVRPGDNPGMFLREKVSTLPGTGQGTAIMGGHALEDSPKVFNPLMQLNERDLSDKSIVILTMPGDKKLIYTIREVLLEKKVDLPTKERLANNDPNRLLVITCNLENGKNSFQNRIFVAYLTSTVGV